MKTVQLKNKIRKTIVPEHREQPNNTPEIATAVCYMILAFVLATNQLVFGLAPVALAFLAAVDLPFLIACGAASTVGYVFLGDVLLSTKYITCVLIILTVRWVFSVVLEAKNEKAISLVSVFAATVISNLIRQIGLNTTVYRWGIIAFEVVFCVLLTVVFFQSFLFFKQMKLTQNKFHLNGKFVMGVTVFLAMVLLAVDNLLKLPFSLTILLLSFLTLLIGYLGQEVYGSMAGITSGLCVAFLFPNNPFIGLGMSFGGMLCGVMRSLGKMGSVMAFALANMVAVLPSLATGNVDLRLEPFIASLAFALIPKSVLVRMPVPENKNKLPNEDMEEIMQSRIQTMAKSLKNISQKVKSYNTNNSILNAGDISSVFTMTMEQVCVKCKNRTYCSTAGYNNLYDSFNKMGKVLTDKHSVSLQDAPDSFKRICMTPGRVVETVNSNYKLFLQLQDQDRKIDRVKENVVEQFSYIGDVLNEMGEELNFIEYLDEAKREKLFKNLSNAGMNVKNITVIVDKDNRLTIQIVLNQNDLNKDEMAFLRQEVDAVTDVTFNAPNCSLQDGEFKLIFHQKANLTLDCYKYQITKDGEYISGDHGSFFSDSGSNSTWVLCDGMGAGVKAGLESEIAMGIVRELIKSGFGYEKSMSITNSALMTKSGEESFSTMDIASIDLYTGKAQLFKAGAVASFVKKGNSTMEISAPSMPIGILSTVNFSRSEMYLNPGDILIMVSDGVTATGTGWVQSVIDNYRGDKPKELAILIGENAKKRNETLHSDDITVMVGMMKRGI